MDVARKPNPGRRPWRARVGDRSQQLSGSEAVVGPIDHPRGRWRGGPSGRGRPASAEAVLNEQRALLRGHANIVVIADYQLPVPAHRNSRSLVDHAVLQLQTTAIPA